MTISTTANTEITNTFDFWRIQTNLIADAMRTKVVTADADVTSGNVVVYGTISSNAYKTDSLTSFGTTSITVSAANLIISSSSGLVTQAPVNVQGTITFQSIGNMSLVGANATHQYLAVNNSTSAMELRKLTLAADDISDFATSNILAGSRSNSSIIVWDTATSKWITGSLSFLQGAQVANLTTNNIIGSSGTINLTSNCVISNTMWTFNHNNRIGINTNAPISALHVNGAIVATGDIQAFQTSDAKFKMNVTPVLEGLALNTLSKLEVCEFDWDPRTQDTDFIIRKEGHAVGLIAQQVREVMPQLVAERPDGTLAVDYTALIPYLLAAVQDLTEQVKELKNGR